MWATYVGVSDSSLGHLTLSLKLPKLGKMRQVSNYPQ